MPREGGERRKGTRHPVIVEIDFSDGSRIFSQIVLQDISAGGVCAKVPLPIPMGTKVCLVLPCNPPIKAKGSLRWCRKEGNGYLAGIQFSDLSPEQEGELRQYLHSLLWDSIRP